MPSIKDSSELTPDPHTRVRQLGEVGSSVVVDPNIPPHRYFRSGNEMVRMAKVYMDEQNLENAFILYTKYITLFVEKLPKHPDYKHASAAEKANTKQKLKQIFPVAEQLKSSLLEAYNKEYEQWLEEKRRIEEAVEQERRRKQEEEERRQKAEQERATFEKEKQWRLAQERERQKLSNYSQDERVLPENQLYPGELYPESPMDTRNNSHSRDNLVLDEGLGMNEDIPVVVSPIEDMIIGNLPVPVVDRSTKPSSLLSPGPSSTHAFGLRTVIVPVGLMDSFLQLAQSNTSQNVETCGILSGKLCQNRFTITHLLVPKQRGTSDSCSTDNEEDILSYQDEHDLITLGWIHTHPSQTAFMSSVDLHSHCSYQLMMPEAIAIVSSPKYQETKIFSLTTDYGVDYIANCRQTGFHPHPSEPPLYEESTHVELDSRMDVKLVDLRKR
ncbi:STAM-binding protein-like [Limulus polyphemus]|uniref:STAM-binding protein-like n=1 Tax=Limulus polyphemus TaxID=6850 RepID=A0ABM1S2H8_LIMPO|nr:STAM-binding protein-like [Limulus polyphemus]XP_022237833.1 STAM-binding protein-like [Limulus polyphemus]